MEKKRDILVEAHARMARALADLGDSAGFESTLKELQKWVDIDKDKKFSFLTIEREKRAGRHGSALKLINSLLKNKGDDTKGGVRPMTEADLLAAKAEIFDHLGYTELAEQNKKSRLISSPQDFLPF